MKNQHTTLITGASRGIGLATARYLAEKGHLVVGLARNHPENDFPGEFISVDLADYRATTEALSDVTKRHSFDGVVNNVGIVKPEALEDTLIDHFHEVIDLNLRVALQTVQATILSMKEKKWGRIVNISSISALGAQNRSSYAAAKAGMISFARTWALEFAAYGITVNTVAPGGIETEMSKQLCPAGSDAEKECLRGIPMGRFGKTQEVAATIGFFFSDEAAYITGQTLFIDGGCCIDLHPCYKAR